MSHTDIRTIVNAIGGILETWRLELMVLLFIAASIRSSDLAVLLAVGWWFMHLKIRDRTSNQAVQLVLDRPIVSLGMQTLAYQLACFSQVTWSRQDSPQRRWWRSSYNLAVSGFAFQILKTCDAELKQFHGFLPFRILANGRFGAPVSHVSHTFIEILVIRKYKKYMLSTWNWSRHTGYAIHQIPSR